ncbi:hypothetical protein BpHYR1_047767 [Brachionus plicatilis]|uniref:Uncharacterized protein n=1 Tax=Brachionus plicatilis TaxID=10195 RepID=A0A3M7T8M8_BRAPC|nr:hypothetical protein BpHYR1_047767 [Brachionus plicatilis]
MIDFEMGNILNSNTTLETLNKLKLLAVSNQLFELSGYVTTGLSNSVPLVVKLVEEYKAGFESRHLEYLTPMLYLYERFMLKSDSYHSMSISTKNK